MRYMVRTSDRRARHGLQEQPDTCFTCLQAEENMVHRQFGQVMDGNLQEDKEARQEEI
jgi:hypothetical protein